VSNVASNAGSIVGGDQIGGGRTVDGQELTHRNVGGAGGGDDQGLDKEVGGKQNGTSCCADDQQNTPLATLQSKGQIVVGGGNDKKTD